MRNINPKPDAYMFGIRDKTAFSFIADLIEEFRREVGWNELPTQYMVIFFTIAANNGNLSVGDLPDYVSLEVNSCSRATNSLAGNRGKKEGFGLLELIEDPLDRRRKTIWLSEKGEKLALKFANKVRAREDAMLSMKEETS